MNTLEELANDIVHTIEKEDAFEKSKKNGGFLKSFKAKNVMEFLDETWNND